MTNTDMPNKVHEGRNVKRFREMLGIKQDTLAYELGEDWSQKKVSMLEQKETIEPDILEQVAKILQISPDAIRRFNEEQAINIFSNNFTDFKDGAIASAMNYQCTFNPIEKIMQLYEEKIELYERMLREKNDMLEKISAKK